MVANEMTHTFKPMIFSTNLKKKKRIDKVTHRVCISFPSVTFTSSPHTDSPLLLDQREAGVWAGHPAAPSGHTVQGWSPTHAPGSLHHVLAAVLLPSDLNRRETRPHTVTAAPEGALLRLSLGHCVLRHPGHRQKVL